MSEIKTDVKEQVRKQYQVAEEISTVSVRTWNELMTASADMAFDVALKNLNYARNVRVSVEKALEEAITTQRSLNSEMLQVWQGYASDVKDIVGKTLR